MTQTASPTGPRLRRVLGMPALVFFGLAYMVPLTVFTTYGLVAEGTEGRLPGAYVVTLAAMLFTAYSYGRMVQAHPSAGSAYSYTQKAFGSSTGFMVGWALLLDYVFLPMLNYLVIGLYLNAEFPGVPNWVWIVGAIVAVTGLNVIGIEVVTRMNLLLVVFQLVFIVVFLVAAFRSIAEQGTPSLTAPFFGGDADLSLLFGGAAILCLSFLGFDAISTLSEETPDPRRTIPRAIIATTLLGGVMFIVISYAGHLAFPQWQDFTDVDAASLDVMARVGGPPPARSATAPWPRSPSSTDPRPGGASPGAAAPFRGARRGRPAGPGRSAAPRTARARPSAAARCRPGPTCARTGRHPPRQG